MGTPDSSTEVVIASRDSLRGRETVIRGTTYSLPTSDSALIVNGVTTTSSAAPTSQSGILTTDPNSLTDDQPISGTFLAGSETVISGTTYPLATSASVLIANGVTTTLSAAPTSRFTISRQRNQVHWRTAIHSLASSLDQGL